MEIEIADDAYEFAVGYANANGLSLDDAISEIVRAGKRRIEAEMKAPGALGAEG